MKAKRMWTVSSFLTCFLWNAVLVGLCYVLAKQTLDGLSHWVDPFLQSGTAGLPEDVRVGLENIARLVKEAQRYLAPVVFGLGGLVTLVLWLFLMLQGRGLANRVQRETQAVEAPKASGKPTKAPAAAVEKFVQASPQAAVQMLSILQREGRFIDFLQEDLNLYEDSQIGAAVRSIHQGCKEALAQHVELKPIFEEAEGGEVTVEPGFDSKAIRLTGNVAGDPPFRGVLRHRGWRVSRLELPLPTTEQKKDWVLAPAEIEI
jgi:hypothetical protein